MERIGSRKALLWILCLAFLSVGARNFETGISLDGPVYSTVARNIARTGEWFRLDASLPDYVPYFADHPHLALWIQALFFRWLPADDWVARMPGHLFYVFFLLAFFVFVQRRSGPRVAVLSVLFLWIWYQFSNTFSNAYLDPACLSFGAVALFAWDASWSRKLPGLAVISGGLLAASFLSKGLTAVGFLPSFALVAISRRSQAPTLRWLTLGGAGMAGVFLPYLWGVGTSQAPDYLSLYWSRQFSGRFLPARSLLHSLEPAYWKSLLRHTYYLGALAPFALPRVARRAELRLPLVTGLSFALLYSSVRLNGGQYLIYVMPWIAWLSAAVIADWITIPARTLARASGALSLGLIFVLQYAPFRTHARELASEFPAIREASAGAGKRRLVLDVGRFPDPKYLLSGGFAWYGDVRVLYRQEMAETPRPSPDLLYLVTDTERARPAELALLGWCRHSRHPGLSLWQECPEIQKTTDASPAGHHAPRIGETPRDRFNHGE